tara:strand:+ start:495 stop:1475 length:981 start_codon:yes stop_codon:yes gene_type:complete
MNEPNMTYKVNKNRGIFYKKEGNPLYIDAFSRSIAWGPPLYQPKQTQQNINQLQSQFKPITGCPGYNPIILTQFNKQNSMDKAIEKRQFSEKPNCVNYLPYKQTGFSKQKQPAFLGNHQHRIHGNVPTFKQPVAYQEQNGTPGNSTNHYQKTNYPANNINQACNGSNLFQLTPENTIKFQNSMEPTNPKSPEITNSKTCSFTELSELVNVDSKLKKLGQPLTLCTKAVSITTPAMGCPGRDTLDEPLYGEIFNNSSKVEYKNPYEYRNPAVVRMQQNSNILQCMDSMTFNKCKTTEKPCDYKYMPGRCENLWNNSTKAKIIGKNHC